MQEVNTGIVRSKVWNGEACCRFIATRMENTWDEFYYKRSFIAVLEKFVHTVDNMESTVLIPSRLMDMPISEILPSSNCDAYLQNNLDLRSFYGLVKAIRTQIYLGSNHIAENEEHNSPLQCEIRETLHRITQLTLVAKYIHTFAQNVDLSSQPLSFNEFEKTVKFSKESNLLGALKKFLSEVEEMEKAVLFPSRLKDHELEGELPIKETAHALESFHDVYTLMKLLKNELLAGPQELQLADQKLQQKLSDLYQTLRRYTTMISSLTTRYKQVVQCF